MADTNGNGTGQAPGAQSAPSLNALVQFTKDFSFENPNAPRSLGPQEKQPNISIQVNVNAKQTVGDRVRGRSPARGLRRRGRRDTLFKFELEYAGIFRLMNIPEEQRHPVVMIECPRLLFPFARQIIAEAVRNGGFPPLYIDPIDFGTLYQSAHGRGRQAGRSRPPEGADPRRRWSSRCCWPTLRAARARRRRMLPKPDACHQGARGAHRNLRR